MPLVVTTDELQPGMQLAEPFVTQGQVMMQSGRPLTEAEVNVLQRRFPQSRLRIADPLLDSVVEFEDDTREREVAAEAQRRVSTCMSQVGQRFAMRASFQDVNFDALQAAVRELMAHMEKNPVSAALVAQCMDSNSFLGLHTGNVFYLSMLLGSAALHLVIAEQKRASWAREVRATFAHDLTPLGLGALLIDIGLIPYQQLLQKGGELSGEERDQVLAHAQSGAGLLPQSINAVSRMIVRSHHENCRGTGYPKGQPREKLHIFTRIVRIADAYDAATSEGVFGGAKHPARVLWEMSRSPYRDFFDQELMAQFARLIQPFPIGSKLRLADGRYAAVVKYNRKNSFDPIVVIAFDEKNQRLSQDQLVGPLQLSSQPDLRIASLYGEDLSFIYSDEVQAEMAAAREFKTPLEIFYP